MKKKNGFTIIEVSLVLAIAGLILILAFIALPGLWRSQRDTQRKEDITTLASNLKKWQSNNNRGSLPTDLSSFKEMYYKDKSFEDPDGTSYKLVYNLCDGKNAGSACGIMTTINNEKFNSHNIYVVTSAACGSDGHSAVKSANARKAAIMYRLEAGNEIFCYEI